METVFTGMEQADRIAARITQSCLAPQPALIFRFGIKDDSGQFQAIDQRIELFVLKINDRRWRGRRLAQMNGERAFSLRAFEACIVRAFHDQPEAERAVERDGRLDGRHGDGYLVEPHIDGALKFVALPTCVFSVVRLSLRLSEAGGDFWWASKGGDRKSPSVPLLQRGKRAAIRPGNMNIEKFSKLSAQLFQPYPHHFSGNRR